MSVNVCVCVLWGGVTRHCGHTEMLSLQSLMNVTTTVQVFATVLCSGLGKYVKIGWALVILEFCVL
jgi:hypothetical protein